ncbi:UDP-N-acetylglucosamine 2-epimerase (non-hydrolyzing) [Patescibacteria group bacterium]|nr:UDP-N-acetylglucosamine 2-epimerase (non-hydrolyzing) [Patescibacteria group bacterium]
MKKQEICIVIGTRPEIIKMAPVIREVGERRLPHFIIHTGQHYSFNLDKVFLDELELPGARYNLDVGSGAHGKQTAKILSRIEPILIEEQPSVVLVEGDTNSVLAASLAASKLHILVGHLEAGLRSYFRFMPEEVNRVLTDHISDFLFAPTERARKNLLKEGISDKKIHVVGNTIVDSVSQSLEIANRKSKILQKLGLKSRKYIVITAHRPENVDVKFRLTDMLKGFSNVAGHYGLPMIWPIHPRTKKRIKELGLNRQLNRIELVQSIEPVGFLDFLMLEANAELILTDSGGVQEEACILGVPCVTLRDNTERLESVEVGANLIAGVDPNKILQSAKIILKRSKNWKNPFGDGKAVERILDVILGNRNMVLGIPSKVLQI